MDKKILLSGVAALLISGGMFATSASAAVTFSHSGEAELSATFNDACSDADPTSLSTSGNATVDDNTVVLTGGTSCTTGDSEDNPVWKTDASLDWTAGGTLANGLGISVGKNGGEGVSIGLDGAFGSVSWEKGGDSAVKAALPNGDGDLTVSSRDGLGGHTLATDGTGADGYVVNYQAPSVGGMDLFVSYAPSSNGSDLNDDAYSDTIAIGATMSAGDITIGAGWESASANSNASTSNSNACTSPTAVTATAGAAGNNVASQADAVLGGAFCGDQTLMGIGASMSVGDLALNAGYTVLDTDEADKTTYNVGVETAVGEYTLALDYVNSSKDYLLASSLDQTVIGATLKTGLGEGVDLEMGFSSSSVDVAETGAHSNYNAEIKLVVGY